MLKVELSRFKVKEGKSGKVDEWMAFLNDHMEDTLLTLENEKMFVESIHREVVNGTEFLYWYSVQGEGGTEVYDSESYIDIRHSRLNGSNFISTKSKFFIISFFLTLVS